MSNNFENSADFLVSNEILDQAGIFTSDNIISTLSTRLNSFFGSLEEITAFIENKIAKLCNVGLISYTGIYYYVN